jgi:hypothetical protein
MDVREIGFGDVDWINLAQDRDRWRALVNRWWNFAFHKMRGISWLAEGALSFLRRTLVHGISCFIWNTARRVTLIREILATQILEFVTV